MAVAPVLGQAWIWPMPRLSDGRPPVMSDGWGSPRDGGARAHKGADIMYRRPSPVTSEQALLEHGSKNYEVPRGTPAFAPASGVIKKAAMTGRGFAVTIDHGGGWETFVTHLEGPAPGVRVGSSIRQGGELGPVGYDPLDKNRIRHVHIELHYQGSAVDPAPYMKNWAVRDASSPLLSLALVGFIGWGLWQVVR